MLSKQYLDEQLYKHLLIVEDELVDSCDANPKAMKSFLDRLAEIQCMATRALAENSLTTRTTALIRTVASTGAALARFASGAQRARADIEERTQPQLVEAMAKLSLESDDQNNDAAHTTSSKQPIKQRLASTTPSTRPDSEVSQPTALPPHVSRCYEWLLQNLHNPYPHHTFRTQVSKDTGVSQRAISDWFTNIRRKIGWNEIWKKHFKKDRILAVNCAQAVFLGKKSKSPISEELREAFLRMKDTANGLFQDVLIPSDAARHLDDLVAGHVSKRAQDKTSDSSRSEPEACRQREVVCRTTSSKALGKRRAESVDRDDDAHVSTAAKSDRRPVKRLRSTSRPLDVSQQPSRCNQRSCSPVPQPTSSTFPPPRPQKRRLSSEDDSPSSKRRRSTCNGNALVRESIDIDTANILEPPLFSTDIPEGMSDIASAPASAVSRVSDQQASSSPDQEADGTLRNDTDSAWLSQIFNFKDFIDLPDIPTLTCDGGDILPPSMEPLPLTTDISISYPDLDSPWSFDIPSLVDSDSCSLYSFESDFPPELKLDEPLLDFVGIQPESGPVSPSAFFDELLRIDNKLRSEQPAGTSRDSRSFTNVLQSIA